MRRATRLWARVRSTPAREAGYLKEDIGNVRAAITPSRVAHMMLVAGGLVFVWSLAQWEIAVAGAAAGVLIVVYGLIFVDVDSDARPRSPKRRGRRPS